MEKIVILTGAGISAESGLGTFRDEGGIWDQFDLSEVATPEGYARDPEKVLSFYNARRENAARAEPHAAHFALARLDAVLVTQNIDNLHERAGSTGVIHMHGEVFRQFCNDCGEASDAPKIMSADAACTACGAEALRPDIVWFGEMPYHMDRIYADLATADLFVAIGTSGTVYPAAGFVQVARDAGVRTLELNLAPSEQGTVFHAARYGPASEIVPAWVDEVLGTG